MKWYMIKWHIKDFFRSWIPGHHMMIMISVDFPKDNKYHTYAASIDGLRGEPDYTTGFPRQYLIFHLKAEMTNENPV